MIPADLLELLRCPVTRQPLAVASAEQVAQANARRTAAGDHSQEGQLLEAGLIRADGRMIYPLRDGIPILLADAGIAV